MYCIFGLYYYFFFRSALFSSGMDDGEMMDCPPAKPIILQQRNNTSLLEARPRLIEEIATSILCPNKVGIHVRSVLTVEDPFYINTDFVL